MYLKSHLTIIENLFDFLYVLVYKQSASLCVPFKSPACFQRSCFFYCTHHRRLSLLCHASRFIFSQFFFFWKTDWNLPSYTRGREKQGIRGKLGRGFSAHLTWLMLWLQEATDTLHHTRDTPFPTTQCGTVQCSGQEVVEKRWEFV